MRPKLGLCRQTGLDQSLHPILPGVVVFTERHLPAGLARGVARHQTHGIPQAQTERGLSRLDGFLIAALLKQSQGKRNMRNRKIWNEADGAPGKRNRIIILSDQQPGQTSRRQGKGVMAVRRHCRVPVQ